MEASNLDNDKIKLSAILARLQWPDPMVRILALEKVATLLKDHPSEEMIEQFKNWISKRELETEVLSGLIILLKAKMENVIEWPELRPLIRSPSILSDVLLRKLYPNADIPPDWIDGHSGFSLENFSDDHRNQNLNPASYGEHIFQEECKKIGFPYRQQLAHELRRLLDAGYPASFSEHYFRPSYSLKFKAHLTPVASDVRLSSFLRVISFFAASTGMPYEYARLFAEGAIPVHLDYTGNEISAKPKNWGEREFSQVALKKVAEENEEIIVYSSGLWSTDKDGNHKDVTIKAVLSKPHHKISAIDLWEKTDLSLNQTRLLQDYCFYGAVTLQKNDKLADILEKEERDFLPLIAQYHPSDQPAWCMAMKLRGYQITPPLMSLDEELRLEPSEDGIALLWGEEKVGRVWFWLEDWSPTFVIDCAPRIGVSVSLTSNFIQSLEDRFGLQIQFLCRVKTAIRDKGYADHQIDEATSFL